LAGSVEKDEMGQFKSQIAIDGTKRRNKHPLMLGVDIHGDAITNQALHIAKFSIESPAVRSLSTAD
jgi:hypothetical protein